MSVFNDEKLRQAKAKVERQGAAVQQAQRRAKAETALLREAALFLQQCLSEFPTAVKKFPVNPPLRYKDKASFFSRTIVGWPLEVHYDDGWQGFIVTASGQCYGSNQDLHPYISLWVSDFDKNNSKVVHVPQLCSKPLNSRRVVEIMTQKLYVSEYDLKKVIERAFDKILRIQ